MSVYLRLQLPESLVEEYEKQSVERNVPLEELIALRLEQVVRTNDDKPIYFSDEERRELDSLLGVNVSSAEQILDRLRRNLSIKLTDGPRTITTLQLQPNLLSKVKSRCFDKNFPKFLKTLITDRLTAFSEGR